MRVLILAFSAAALLMGGAAGAANHEGQEVIDAVLAYWKARNDDDFATQASYVSSKGTLDANSDGSFFRSSPKATAKELEEQAQGSQATQVYYPEATMLGEGVAMARYYLEGVLETSGGTVSNYRTRVTTVLVNEDGGWKFRSWHFSPLHNGGRHITTKTDFED